MRIEQNNKGIKEKEEKSDEIRLAHNFNFISMNKSDFICAFNIKVKL